MSNIYKFLFWKNCDWQTFSHHLHSPFFLRKILVYHNNVRGIFVHPATLYSGTDVDLSEVQVVKDNEDVTNVDLAREVCLLYFWKSGAYLGVRHLILLSEKCPMYHATKVRTFSISPRLFKKLPHLPKGDMNPES